MPACSATGKRGTAPLLPWRGCLRAMRRNRTKTLLKLRLLRVGFALGSQLAPQRTVDRAARLFATPFASSRSRARKVSIDGEMRRSEITVANQTIATYVWGDPASQPYALLVHG